MPRYFTLEEAERVLPQVKRHLEQALVLKHEHSKAGAGLDEIARRVTLSGGMNVNREQLLGLRSRKDATEMRLREIIDEVQSLGVQIKDMDIGLVDFPTLYRGEEVLLCYRLGEDSIQFWHSLTDGYGGRKRIDADFLERHRGDAPE